MTIEKIMHNPRMVTMIDRLDSTDRYIRDIREDMDMILAMDATGSDEEEYKWDEIKEALYGLIANAQLAVEVINFYKKPKES